MGSRWTLVECQKKNETEKEEARDLSSCGAQLTRRRACQIYFDGIRMRTEATL